METTSFSARRRAYWRSHARDLARRWAASMERVLRSGPWAGRTGPLWFEIELGAARALRALERARDDRIDVSLPGRALLEAAPDAIERLSARLEQGSVLVSATNGKTTTTAMLTSILRGAGWRPVTNRVGANMAGGVAAALAARSRAGGRMAGDVGVFEVDELWLDRVASRVQPRLLVLGNVFRDQLDRVGEVDTLVRRWTSIVDESPPGTGLVLCADDPRLALLGSELRSDRPTVLFGIEDPSVARPSPAGSADIPDCRECGVRYEHDAVVVGHLGRWRCSGCGTKRPDPDVFATDVRLGGIGGCSFTLHTPRGEARVGLRSPGAYNVYNALAAAAAAHALGAGPASIARGLARTSAVFGRAEDLTVGDTRLVVFLVKNPTGADEVLRVLGQEAEEGALELLCLLSDRSVDGRDVSWIWDADFEGIAPQIGRATCAGRRGADLALRLKYAGVPRARLAVLDDVEDALGAAVGVAGRRPVFVLANYTAMLELRELLAEQGHVPRYWR